jgi:hypothetical protein
MSRPDPAAEDVPFTIAELRAAILRAHGPTHPLYLAVSALPEDVTPEQYVAQLRVLLPLARIWEA